MSNLPYLLLPELKYERERLLELVENDGKTWSRYDGFSNKIDNHPLEAKYLFTNHNTWYFKGGSSIIEHPLVEDIASKITVESNVGRRRYYMFREGTVMDMHIDWLRPSALLIPLTLDRRPLTIVGEDGIAHKVPYDVPILINSLCEHGLVESGERRVNLQFSYRLAFDEIVELHRNGELIKG